MAKNDVVETMDLTMEGEPFDELRRNFNIIIQRLIKNMSDTEHHIYYLAIIVIRQFVQTVSNNLDDIVAVRLLCRSYLMVYHPLPLLFARTFRNRIKRLNPHVKHFLVREDELATLQTVLCLYQIFIAYSFFRRICL